MSFQREKFKALVQYICWRTNDPSKLGAVKLNKILWLADFTAYYRHSKPITGARYIKQQFGPVPGAIVPVLHELEQDGELAVGQVQHPSYSQKTFTALRPPSMESFASEEIDIIDSVLKYVCEAHTARSISELSHDHIWHAAQIGEELPYYTIFARPAQLDDDELTWAHLTVADLAA